MGKLFAVTIIVIAIISAIPIVRHTWEAPEDISTNGALIDEQMAETMAEAGIAFLAAQLLLGLFVWQFSNRPSDAKLKNFPGGAKGLVIGAFLLVGLEVLALGVFGVKAWANAYLIPPAPNGMPIQVSKEIPLLMHSKDVGHSFFVRELRVQQDFVPGLDVSVHFTANKVGKYEIVCTQLCGLGHYNMKAYLEVMSQQDYEDWLKKEAAMQ